VRFDLLLDVMHHGYGSNQHDGGDDLVRVQAGVKEFPGDAYRSQGFASFSNSRRWMRE